jgi:hypothetical protein
MVALKTRFPKSNFHDATTNNPNIVNLLTVLYIRSQAVTLLTGGLICNLCEQTAPIGMHFFTPHPSSALSE